MRKIFTLALLAAALNLINFSTVLADQLYSVSVTNLTRGQILSPMLAITHTQAFRLFQSGQPASPGLAALAQDADTSLLEAELSASSDVEEVMLGNGVIMPGKTDTVTIKTANNKRYLSVAAMLVTTNDAFYALNAVRAPKKDTPIIYTVPAYDAGAEANNEMCDYIPGPPCNNPHQQSTEAGEGFVHIHAGIHGSGDLSAADFDWRNPVVLISIRRLDDD